MPHYGAKASCWVMTINYRASLRLNCGMKCLVVIDNPLFCYYIVAVWEQENS